MSYCRFSSDNWRSDVYVYEDVSGGFVTHVASSRSIFPIIPELPMSITKTAFGCWIWQLSHRLHMWSVRVTPKRKIGGKSDGVSYVEETPFDCAQQLIELRRQGYHVPQYAIDALMGEWMSPGEQL